MVSQKDGVQKDGQLERLVKEECTVYRTADGRYLVENRTKLIEVSKLSKSEEDTGSHKCRIPLPFFLISCSLAVLAGSGWGAYLGRKLELFKQEVPAKISESAIRTAAEIRLNPGSVNVTYHPGPNKVYPPLNSREGSRLDSLFGKRKSVQNFIVNKTKYLSDEKQFSGNLCAGSQNGEGSCDVFTTAVHFYRTKKGDCDDVLAFSHYLLNNGAGIYLDSKDPAVISHIVYAYREDGKYGIISINESEQTEANFQSMEEAANFAGRSYDYYQIVRITDDSEKLLYGFDIKNDVVFGPKIYFSKDGEKSGDEK
ncbi:MAG: hypothetical protein AABW53_00615 [Nanoarchaeota archaeon]